MRKEFFKQLYEVMKNNSNVWALTGDLGYGGFDKIRKDFPNRFLNCGASEQTMLDLAVGLSYAEQIPFVYTITPFFLRGFETLRTYISHENLPIKLCGSGRDNDYEVDGFSHDATDFQRILSTLDIIQDYPEELSKDYVAKMVKRKFPEFVSLKR
jgi:transketolase